MASASPNRIAISLPVLPQFTLPWMPTFVAVLNLTLLLFAATPVGTGPISVLRAVFVVGYLSLVPGWLLIGLIDPERNSGSNIIGGERQFDSTERTLYSFGLSLLSLIFIGLVVNTALPLVGVDEPLRPLPLALGLSLYSGLLAVMHEQREIDPRPSLIELRRGAYEWRVIVFFSFLPVVALVGAHFNRVYWTNIPTLLFLLLVTAIPLLLIGGAIPEHLHPFSIYTTTLGLLVFGSLHTSFLTGRDANWEYYFSSLVIERGWWDPAINFKADVMLGISLLRPGYALLTGLPLESVYKYISIVMFAAVPVGLYHVSRSRSWVTPRIAYLSTFLFISFWSVYTKLTHNYRQQLAMIFLILLLVAWQHSRQTGRQGRVGSLLIVLFGAGLMTAHYATAFVFLTLSVFVISIALPVIFINNRVKWFSDTPYTLPVVAVSGVLVTSVMWYMYVGNGILFRQLSRIGGMILIELIGVQTSVSATGGSGARWITRDLYSISYEVFRWLNYVTVGFVTIGYLWIVYHDLRERTLARLEYILFSSAMGLMLVAAVLFPSANPIDLARLYPIALFWIAPLAVKGALLVFGLITSVLRGNPSTDGGDFRQVPLGLFLAIFLLYSSGFIPAVTGEFQYNNALLIEQELEDPLEIADAAGSIRTAQDVAEAEFLAEHREITYPVLTDFSGVFLWSYGDVPRQDRWPPVESATKIRHPPSAESVPVESYVFIRPLNIEDGIFVANIGDTKYSGEANHYDSEEYIREVGLRKHLVYSNGGRIYV